MAGWRKPLRSGEFRGNSIPEVSPVAVDFAPSAGTTQVVNGGLVGASIYTISGPGTVKLANGFAPLGAASMVELDGGTLELAHQNSLIWSSDFVGLNQAYTVDFGSPNATLQIDAPGNSGIGVPYYDVQPLTNLTDFAVGDQISLVGYGLPTNIDLETGISVSRPVYGQVLVVHGRDNPNAQHLAQLLPEWRLRSRSDVLSAGQLRRLRLHRHHGEDG
jgi:hypothetical protein